MPCLELPQGFLTVSYSAARHPGAARLDDLSQGANCQRFAYALLAHYGIDVPPWRSSDLWEDTCSSHWVTRLEPLDLLLWNKTPDAYGAHVGVYLGEGRAVHLSRRVGRPAVWELEVFRNVPDYHVFIGAKRMTRRNDSGFAAALP